VGGAHPSSLGLLVILSEAKDLDSSVAALPQNDKKRRTFYLLTKKALTLTIFS